MNPPLASGGLSFVPVNRILHTHGLAAALSGGNGPSDQVVRGDMRILATAGRRLIVAFILALLWAVTALWAVPTLIRSAYAGESLAVLNRLIQGQANTPVDAYLEDWQRFAWNATWIVVVLAALAITIAYLARRMRELNRIDRHRSSAFQWHDVLVLAIWTGTVAGLAEAVNGIVRHRIQHLPTGEVVSAELFWLVPLAAATTFLALGLLIIALDRILPARFKVLRIAPALFAGLAVYSLFRALGVGLANIAVIVLASGVAVVTMRAFAKYPGSIRWMIRRTTPWMIGGLVAWAIIIPLWRRAVESRIIAALPDAAPDAPNVLVIIWDTARALNLSLYGYERETTPELERLAARGAAFERAFSTSSWSLPSHASIFTGRYPPEMSVGRQIPLNDRHPTLAEVLGRRGYATGGFTANLFYGSSDYGIARGFSWYDARPAINGTVIAHTWWLSRTSVQHLRNKIGRRGHMLRRRAQHVNRALLDWTSRHTDRPFFAVVNHFDAHEPYLPPEPFNLAFSTTQPRYWFADEEPFLSAEILSELKDAYDSSIRYLDHELSRLLRTLEESGELENTLIIVTSDHGEEFGEHGVDHFGHARSAYAASLLVPLVVVYPPVIAQGVRVRDPVSIRDIPATVMDVLGAADSHPFPGTSLARYANGKVTEDERAEPRLSTVARHPWGDEDSRWPAARSDLFSIVAGDLHYIVHGKNEELLYDLSTDVFEQRNLVDSAEVAPTLARLRFVLDSMVRSEDGSWRVRAVR